MKRLPFCETVAERGDDQCAGSSDCSLNRVDQQLKTPLACHGRELSRDNRIGMNEYNLSFRHTNGTQRVGDISRGNAHSEDISIPPGIGTHFTWRFVS
jgi:hypothetical protein